jgi:hypothetical protein
MRACDDRVGLWGSGNRRDPARPSEPGLSRIGHLRPLERPIGLRRAFPFWSLLVIRGSSLTSENENRCGKCRIWFMSLP